MKAIIQLGSHQIECSPGLSLVVLRLPYAVGEEFSATQVQWLSTDPEQRALIGKPYIEGASVRFQVTRHFRGTKGIVFKKRSKKAWKKKKGFRAELTQIKVQEIKTN